MEALRLLGATAFYGLLGWHLWSRRRRLEGLGQLLRSVAKPAKGAGDGDEALDKWADRQMDEFRVQSTQAVVEALSFSTAASLAVIFAGQTSLPQADSDGIALAGSIIYPFFLAARHDGQLRVTPKRANAFYVFLSVLLMGHVIVAGDANLYFVGSLRTLFRFISGFMVLDKRLSTTINAAWSCVLIHEHLYKMPPELSAICRLDFVVYEVLTLLGMQFFLSWAEGFLHSHFRLHVSMAVATNWQQTVKRLLSVLCDAELQLSASLAIWDPSHKVTQLLAPDQAASDLQGRCFTDFVAKPDLERFESFLSLSAGSSAPASLQLHLNDTTGYAFPVEIFLASMPDLIEERRTGSHLIGIKDCGVGKEVSEAAAPRGPTFGPGCPPPPAPPPPQVKAGKEHKRQDDASSSASGLRAIDLPELHIFEVSFDPLHEDMPISELRIVFKATNERGEKLQPPLLCSWFHDCCKDRLRDWVQENCNTFAVGGGDYTSFNKTMVLQLPPASDPTLLKVSEMALDFQGGGDENDDDSTEEGEEEGEEGAGGGERPTVGCEDEEEEGGAEEPVVGVIRLEKLQQLSTACKKEQRRKSRASSHSSRRSAPQLKPMQPIQED